MNSIMDKTTPLVVADVGWGETLPDWLKKEIHSERMILGLCNIAKKSELEPHEQVGDAEVVAYLMTASFRAPMDRDFVDIYLFLTGRLMKKVKNVDMPSDMKIDKLTDYQESELKDLKYHIWKGRGGKFKHPVIEMLEQVKKECGVKT